MPLSSAFVVGLSSLCITTIRKVFLFPVPVSSHKIFEYLRMASIICPKERWLFGPDKQGLCSHHPAFLKMLSQCPLYEKLPKIVYSAEAFPTRSHQRACAPSCAWGGKHSRPGGSALGGAQDLRAGGRLWAP